jgi:hypothetical protein
MPAIVIVLAFLVLFLLAFLAVLLAPLFGVGFAIWKHGKDSSDGTAEPGAAAQVCK